MRSDLRLDDLKGRSNGNKRSKLMNVKVPVDVSEEIDRVARELGATKTDVVVALLNEGLDESTVTFKGFKPKRQVLVKPKRTCTKPGCERAYVAKGFCANHYQASRRTAA